MTDNQEKELEDIDNFLKDTLDELFPTEKTMTGKSEIKKAAEAWANQRCPEQGPEFIVWCMCCEDYEAGALWLLEQLIEYQREQQNYSIQFKMQADRMIGIGDVIRKARELCGK